MMQARAGLAKRLFFWPAKNTSYAISLALILGFIIGSKRLLW
ncbi:MAG: hypothetical protein ACOX0T_09055 [Pelotomaculum sp.]